MYTLINLLLTRMPGAGGPAASLTEFLAGIQTAMYGLIADLTSRVNVLEEKSAINPTASSGLSTVYTCTEPTTTHANFPDPSQSEVLNASPSIGSSTIPGGTLSVGSVVVINVNGSSSTGGGAESLTLTLWGSPEPPILACSSALAVGYGGAIDATFVLTMGETTAVVRATIINGSDVQSSSSVITFDRSVDCSFSLISSWSDAEGGGALTIQARTIEIKSPPA